MDKELNTNRLNHFYSNSDSKRLDRYGETPEVETESQKSSNRYLKDFMDFMVGLPKLGDNSTESVAQEVEEPEDEASYKSKKLLIPDLNKPLVQKTLQSIKNLKLGLRESALIPTAKQGSHRGIYQFNDDSLRAVGISPNRYDNDLNAQHAAALKYKQMNLSSLKEYQKYIGKSFRGTVITANGMAAAAHLLGAGVVTDWFEGTTNTTLAKNGFRDGLGTHITEYFNLFT
jgi:hypothetical protein